MLTKEKAQEYLSGKGHYMVTIFRYIWIIPSVLAGDPIFDTLFEGKAFTWNLYHTICTILAILLVVIYIVIQRLAYGYKKDR